MRWNRLRVTPSWVLILIASFAALWLGGCNIVGPHAIVAGRMAYNEAVTRTSDQQLLNLIVRKRYGEAAGWMLVSSITANVKVSANANAEFGVGPSENYLGNLVPISGGVAYEENPTISYVPLRGEKYMRQALAPLPMDVILMYVKASPAPEAVMRLFVSRMNGLSNRAFRHEAGVEADARFDRAIWLISDLFQYGCTDLVQAAEGDTSRYAFLFHNFQPEYVEEVTELMELLGQLPPQEGEERIVLPIQFAVDAPHDGGIALQTRSLVELTSIAAASVQVPEEHQEAGYALELPETGPVGDLITIHSAKKPPKDALVAVEYRGWWYYIALDDGSSKDVFNTIRNMMNFQIADEGDAPQSAPVLTVPVG